MIKHLPDNCKPKCEHVTIISRIIVFESLFAATTYLFTRIDLTFIILTIYYNPKPNKNTCTLRLHDLTNLPITCPYAWQVLALAVLNYLFFTEIGHTYIDSHFALRVSIHTTYLKIHLNSVLLKRKTAKSGWSRDTIRVTPNCLSSYCIVCVWIYIFV